MAARSLPRRGGLARNTGGRRAQRLSRHTTVRLFGLHRRLHKHSSHTDRLGACACSDLRARADACSPPRGITRRRRHRHLCAHRQRPHVALARPASPDRQQARGERKYRGAGSRGRPRRRQPHLGRRPVDAGDQSARLQQPALEGFRFHATAQGRRDPAGPGNASKRSGREPRRAGSLDQAQSGQVRLRLVQCGHRLALPWIPVRRALRA